MRARAFRERPQADAGAPAQPVWGYCLDAHVHGSRPTYGSWRWVSFLQSLWLRCCCPMTYMQHMQHAATLAGWPSLTRAKCSFFYSGLARRKSALSLIWLSVMSAAVTCFQWFFWGYSLTFSHTAGPFIGDLSNFAFRNVLARPSVGSDKVPDLLFAVYQGMFSAITVALATGAVAERGRMLPCVIFMFVWATVIYDPIACWTWNPSGWSTTMGGLDFAGGTPVHIASGSAALAYSMMLGKRRGHGTHELNYRPHNVTHIVIGTVFLWIGWFGFNAGSALSANMRGVMAAVVTNLAACVGGMTWCILDYRLERKWSTVGFCSGVVAGLVSITPGSGTYKENFGHGY